MPIPEFVSELRALVGTGSLFLSGVTAAVIRGVSSEQEVVLVRRNDSGLWTPVTGIIDPGEQPADAAAREVLEEAGLVVTPDRLVLVQSLPEHTYTNGDRVRYLDMTFRMRWSEGEPFPADDENSEVRWFRFDALPQISDNMRERIELARQERGEAAFRFASSLRSG